MSEAQGEREEIREGKGEKNEEGRTGQRRLKEPSNMYTRCVIELTNIAKFN